MVSFTLLGTGTPAPSLRRQSSGYALQVGTDVIVIDHGPGAAHRLLEAGLRPTDVTHVMLSHLHYDHMADYPRLFLQRWDVGSGKIGELYVAGPAPLAAVHQRLFAPDGAFGPDITSRTTIQASLDVFAARGGQGERHPPAPTLREIAPGDTLTGAAWTMRVAKATHFEPALTCLAFRFDTPDGVIVYTGDTGGVTDEIVTLAKGCDVLIHMCHAEAGTEPSAEYARTVGSHLDAAKAAAASGAKALVLTHLPPSIDKPATLARLTREMAPIYDGPIIVGEDLMTLSLEAGVLSATRPARRGADPLQALDKVVAATNDIQAVCAAADAAAQATVGHGLFTVMRLHRDAMEVERLYSSQPDAYPPGGRKPKKDTAWTTQVLKRGKPYFGTGPNAIRSAFNDHATILALGLDCVINVPVVRDDVVVGTVNCLAAPGELSTLDVPHIEAIAARIASAI